jgi:hypothetical protein
MEANSVPMYKLQLIPKKAGFIVRVDDKRAGEITRKRGRPHNDLYLPVDPDVWTTCELYEARSRSAIKAHRTCVEDFCYVLNREAFLERNPRVPR